MDKDEVKKNLKEILENYDVVKIPEIQRDYVMGSGGEKLIKLFTAINECVDNEFYFSCLFVYECKEEKKTLYIYDGQQRLVTLICLCSYLNQKNKDEQAKEDIRNLLNKFEFIGRDKANEWIKDIDKIKENDVVDFSTYSICNLITKFKNFSESETCKIDLEFLLEKVYFNIIIVDKMSDAEQFFLDINEGLDLKLYEIFKAELYHHASKVIKEKKDFKRIALKMENEWLKLCLKYKEYNNIDEEEILMDEEEILMCYLKYCFRIIWIEEKGNDTYYKETDVGWLKECHFKRIEKITDIIVFMLNTYYDSNNSAYYNNSNLYINYSINYDEHKEGPHWNIADTNYIKMLDDFFRNICKTQETKKDIIIWCYISNLPKYINLEHSILLEDINSKLEPLYLYLRMIKKVLNHNRGENTNAIIKYKGRGREKNQIVYARYYVKDIPKYYVKDIPEHYDIKNIANNNEDKNFFYLLVLMNQYFAYNNCLVDGILEDKNFKQNSENNMFTEILKKENLKQTSKDKDIIKELEDIPFINGLVDNFIDYDYKSGRCELKQWVNEPLLKELKENKISEYQYRNILNFICDKIINIEKCMFDDVQIFWKAGQQGTKLYRSNQNQKIITHSWADLFTNTNKKGGIEFLKIRDDEFFSLYFNLLPLLPDGWFDGCNIIQPQINVKESTYYKINVNSADKGFVLRKDDACNEIFDLDIEDKKGKINRRFYTEEIGFKKGNYVETVYYNITDKNFLKNFSKISIDKDNYCITINSITDNCYRKDIKIKKELIEFKMREFLEEHLSKNKIIFFSENKNLNALLLNFLNFLIKEKINVDYSESKDKEWICYSQFFIKGSVFRAK